MANIPKNQDKTVSEEGSTFAGSCACKRISYTCNAMPSTTQACNCVTCRKLSGGPHQVFADVDAKSVVLLDSQTRERYAGFPKENVSGIEYLRLSSVGERAFCVSCHTPLMMRYSPHPDTIGITLGSIDEETIANDTVKSALKPKSHIFGSQGAFWTDLSRDGIPVNERFSPELGQTYPDLETALQASE